MSKPDLGTCKGVLQAIYNSFISSVEDVGLGDIRCVKFYYYNVPICFMVTEKSSFENTLLEFGELRALYRDLEKVKYFTVYYLNGGEQLFELKPVNVRR